MAESATHPNNVAVKFRGKGEREMPKPPGMDVSTTKVSPTKGKKLPRRARKVAKAAARRGLISEKAMAKHMGEA